ncbi:RCC1 domain-containing protein [Spirillospora albida]|uniref:RCC1 domain-containing protein n=1 Tax=Spirillospora albida TaxID=58123 RepID=UPI000A0577EB|nr:chromosome condensation regulator RCC1 [Spirillospora albida]
MIAARRSIVALLVPSLVLTAAACDRGKIEEQRVAPPPSAPPAGSAGGQSGIVWSSGLNGNGQLGRKAADLDPSLAPVTGPDGKTPLGGVVAIAGGGRHSIAVLSDGNVVAWGANDRGQLGNGTTRDSAVPVPVRAPAGEPGRLGQVVAISANSDFSMALRRDGTVVAWGEGGSGQRGDGRMKTTPLPNLVRTPDARRPLTGITAIAADGRTELALRRDGRVFAWGANKFGMVGDGTVKTRPLPVPVRGQGGTAPLGGVARIAIGGQHGLALLRDGRVLAWGRNEKGQLGDGSGTDRRLPGPVKGVRGAGRLSGVIAISAAEKHNYALRKDGTAVAWGNNTAGQLGDGTLTQRGVPVVMVSGHGPTLRGVQQVHAGEAYGAAILSDGTPMTWGAGGRGQLGSGNRVARSRPGPLVMTHGATPEKVLTAAVGERHLLLLMRP